MSTQMATQDLLLFGDQTVQLYQEVLKLSVRSQKSSTLHTFLRQAADRIEIESADLGVAEKLWLPSFNGILDLADKFKTEEDTIGLVNSLLTCIVRLGELISHVENEPAILGEYGPEVQILGICTGLLPAAATAIARDIFDLIYVGCEIIALTFRVAVAIIRRTKQVDQSPGHWASLIIGSSVAKLEENLKEFHTTRNIPPHRELYLGVISNRWMTIFGPPRALREFLTMLSTTKERPTTMKISAYGAVHSKQLGMPDLQPIIRSSPILSRSISQRHRIMSTSSCKPYVDKSMNDIIFHICEDIFSKTLLLSDAVESTLSMLKPGITNLRVMGPTTHEAVVRGAMETKNLEFTLIKPSSSEPQLQYRAGSGAIAIVGMAGRFPGGNSLSELWETLLAAKDIHKEMPADRFEISDFYDPTGKSKNSTSAKHGCFLDAPGLFDPSFFKISPREALQMEPIHRLLLMTSYEALETAGYSDFESTPHDRKRVSTFLGQTASDWIDVSLAEGIDIYYIPGLGRAFGPGRLNYHFKWDGPAYSVDSACTSGGSAVGLACSALLSRDCDMALAGGGSITAAPNVYAGLSKAGFLSPTGACKTFSEEADGYCRGEGVGVLVLKRVEDALRDNDNILAVIRSFAANQAADAVTITHPDATTQTNVFRRALQSASIEPKDIDFVEMHGTGTQAGDLAEMTSVINVFRNSRKTKNPLTVGSLKATIGHGEASAALASLIKGVLVLNKGTIPSQPPIQGRINRKFPSLDDAHVAIANQTTVLPPSQQEDGNRKVLVNNFDATGGNRCFVLEEYRASTPVATDPRTYHVITTSAKSNTSLYGNKTGLLNYLKENPAISINDLAYTTTARRIHHHLRTGYVANNIQQLIGALEIDLKQPSSTTSDRNKRPVHFVFTGQGSQYAGMGAHLFRTNEAFREDVLSMQRICDMLQLPYVVDSIASTELDIETRKVSETHLAIVILEIALARLWQSWGIEPATVLGHSLGEYAALCIAGVLSVADTLYLVGARGRLIEQKCKPEEYAMVSIMGSPAHPIENLLSAKNSCEISCFNSPASIVVSGKNAKLKSLVDTMQDGNLRFKWLPMKYGFHSSQMDLITEDIETLARGIRFKKPEIPIISSLTAAIVNDEGVFDPTYMARQTRNAVNFELALKTFVQMKPNDAIWLEIGPDPICSGMIRSTLQVSPRQTTFTLTSKEDNWKTINSAIHTLYTSGVKINWRSYHYEYEKSLRLLSLPTYAFDLKNYWITYKLPAPVDKEDVRKSITQETYPISTLLQCSLSASKKADDGFTFPISLSAPQTEVLWGRDVKGNAEWCIGIFLDVALRSAHHVYRNLHENTGSISKLGVKDMRISSPTKLPEKSLAGGFNLVAKPLSKEEKDFSVIVILYESYSASERSEFARCEICVADRSISYGPDSRLTTFAKARLESILQMAPTNQIQKLHKKAFYKILNSTVMYDESYRAVEEVYLSNDLKEAVASMRLVSPKSGAWDGIYPPWTDAFTQLATFLPIIDLESDDPSGVALYPDECELVHFFSELQETACYNTYIQLTKKDGMEGYVADVYAFDKDSLVCVFLGLCLRPRTKVIQDNRHQQPNTVLPTRSLLSEKKSQNIKNGQSYLRYDQTKSAAVSTNSSSVNEFIPTPLETSATSSVAIEEDFMALLASIVAEETGADLEVFTPLTYLSDVGVDSIMGIELIEKIESTFGVELPLSLFNSNPSMENLLNEIKVRKGQTIKNDVMSPTNHQSVPSAREPDHRNPSYTDEKNVSEFDEALIHEENTVPHIKSNAIRLQSSPSQRQRLFLITDGTGSATSYIHLPRLKFECEVILLESPFVRDPDAYTVSIEFVAEIYLKAIQKIQPNGPYILGGYSMGGIYSYEICRLLIAKGQTVDHVFVIDMIAPGPSTRTTNSPTMEQIRAVGLLEGLNRSGPSLHSERMARHVFQSISAFSRYRPVPLSPGHNVCLTVIWAEHRIPAASTIFNQWFLWDRRDLGPNSWDVLFGGDKVSCQVVGNADHFSIMRLPHVEKVTKVIGDLLND